MLRKIAINHYPGCKSFSVMDHGSWSRNRKRERAIRCSDQDVPTYSRARPLQMMFLLVVVMLPFWAYPVTSLTPGFVMLKRRKRRGSCPFRPSSLTLRMAVGSEASSSKRPLRQRENNAQQPFTPIQDILNDYGYDDGGRIIHLSPSQLPVLAEVQEEGTTRICRIVEIQQQEAPEKRSSPKFGVIFMKNESGDNNEEGHVKTVDIGQITTIWQHKDGTSSRDDNSVLVTTASERVSDKLLMNAPQVHEMLERLYKSKVGQGRSSNNKNNNATLTKKQIQELAMRASSDAAHQDFIMQLLRQIVKTGPNFVRLIDSSFVSGQQKSPSSSQRQQRLLLAQLLGDSHFNGGRFKRWPCLWLPSDDPMDEEETVTLFNGGWLVVDQSVRASNEGRRFAEQQQQKLGKHDQEGKNSAVATTHTSVTSSTIKNRANPETDERIAHRLECLAMGDEPDNDGKKLEVDVRAALCAMGFPPTSEGTREALVQMGRWTKDPSSNMILPWSQSVLQASKWFQDLNEKRKSHLYQQSQKKEKQSRVEHLADLDSRVDLTHLPCICVDAAKASFRDDAIGIRPRASTGRKVNPNASKWEILLHIADVSDIYAADRPDWLCDERGYLQTLRAAAASRGTSRYDLPRGPLHMLPTSVLESLSLEVFKPDWTSVVSLDEQLQDGASATVNRCVTMWVYINEQSGKILDAGLERTLVSQPVALSFQAAAALLDGRSPMSTKTKKAAEVSEDPMVFKMRTILKVAERNIQQWSDYHTSTSKYARQREDRRNAYEEMSQNVYGSTNRRDDGKDGFRRTRGHRLVDAAMDLYGYALTKLVQRAGGRLPHVVGVQDGRVATGPLRRYIDGIAQRQALSILCGYGGAPLSKQECAEIGRKATESLNRISNFKASKQVGKSSGPVSSTKVISQKQQQEAVRMLTIQLRNIKDKKSILLPAVSTGKGSEVLLMDVGAVASCRGIKGTLRPGTKVKVRVEQIDEENDSVLAVLEDD